MGAIDIKSAGKIYPNGTRALEDVSITINDGEFVVLVGPSGWGKTTLLRMVAGLEDITEGEIAIGDKTVNEVAPKDRDIAMVFQNYALYPHMSVYDNMAFSLKLIKLPKDEIEQKVKVSLLEQLGSDSYVHFYKDIKPVQTEAIEEILADEGEDITVLGDNTKFIARINPNSTVAEGEEIELRINPSKLHFFDPESGDVI